MKQAASELPSGLKIISLVGHGGFASVYKVEHKDLGKTVAVKVLHSSMDSDLMQRFVQEANICATKLVHPNIVRVYSFGITTSSRPYIVMQYIDGISLAEYCKQQRRDWRHCFGIAEQILGAVAYAHKQGIVHRDLKPGNILVSSNPDSGEVPRVYVCDFGLAKDLTGGEQRLTALGSTVGTPGYMSPEQAKGCQVDERTDVFSIGCILYELLAGTTPFPVASSLSRLWRHLSHKPAQLTNVPPSVDALVRNALEKDRSRRFFSAEQFLQAVHTVAKAPYAPYRQNAGTAQPTLIAWLIAVCTIGCVALLGWLALAVSPPNQKPIVTADAQYLVSRAVFNQQNGMVDQCVANLQWLAKDGVHPLLTDDGKLWIEAMIIRADLDKNLSIVGSLCGVASAIEPEDPDIAFCFHQRLSTCYFHLNRTDEMLKQIGAMETLLPRLSDDFLLNFCDRSLDMSAEDLMKLQSLRKTAQRNAQKLPADDRQKKEGYCRDTLATYAAGRACNLQVMNEPRDARAAMSVAERLFDPQYVGDNIYLLLIFRSWQSSFYACRNELARTKELASQGTDAYSIWYPNRHSSTSPAYVATCEQIAAHLCFDLSTATQVPADRKRLLEKCLDHSEKAGTPDSQSVAALTALGDYQRDCGDKEKARHLYNQGIAISLKQKPPLVRAAAALKERLRSLH